MENKTLATEIDFLQLSTSMSRRERVTNEKIQRRTNRQETIMEEILKKQLMWYGHVNRTNNEKLPKSY